LHKISIFFTYVSIKIGLTANAVSKLSILVSLAAYYLLSTGDSSLVILGAVLINVGQLFDCVDGEVARYARYRGDAKPGAAILGSFLEGANSNLMDALLLPSIAFGLYAVSTKNYVFVVLACFGAVSRLLFGLLQQRAKIYNKRSPDAFRRSKSRIVQLVSYRFSDNRLDTDIPGRFVFLVYKNLATSSGILLPLAFVFALLKRLDIYVALFSIEYICTYVVAVLLILIASNKIVSRGAEQQPPTPE
jgi:phosphatidylglycerophosphate synthase